MNPLAPKEAEKIFSAVAKNAATLRKVDVVVCPPAIYAEKLKRLSRKISLGAQDAFWGETGAQTGEISAEMLYELGLKYAILGHSERRARGESDADVNKKIKSALSAGLRPILCVGETVRDEEHNYFAFVKEQLERAFEGVSKNSIGSILIAYEPVWAISSTPGRHDATPEDASEMSIFIRKILSDKFGKDAAKTKILYGGSVSDRDVGDFVSRGGVDGFLVGKASITPEKFSKILAICEASKS